ncbi:hypothetical protein HGRIS_004830 [Hohenbuehelia grisea]|uniref:F-box domain-containing protein n=1 Tax=Hohenbuehelia grisea TaxID=104357 RepID=A0ABR3JDQ8_9AGAR
MLSDASRNPIQFPAHLPLEILTMILLLALPPIPDLVTYWTTPLEYILLEGIIADFWKRRGDISRVCRRWRDALKSQCQILPVPHYSMTDTTLNEIQAIILDRAATFSMALPSGRRGPRVDFGMLQDAQDIMGVSWQRLVAFVLQQGFDFSSADAVHEFFGSDAPKLRRLYLTGSSTVVQVVPGSIFNGNAPQLRELVLNFCVVCPQAPFVGNLTHLCIQCTANADETAVYDVLHAAKALEHLSLLWALSDRGDASSLDATPLRLPALRHLRIGGDGRLGGTFDLFSRLKASSDLDVEVLWYRLSLNMTVNDVSKVRKDLWEMFMWWRVEMEVDEVAHQLASSGFEWDAGDSGRGSSWSSLLDMIVLLNLAYRVFSLSSSLICHCSCLCKLLIAFLVFWIVYSLSFTSSNLSVLFYLCISSLIQPYPYASGFIQGCCPSSHFWILALVFALSLLSIVFQPAVYLFVPSCSVTFHLCIMPSLCLPSSLILESCCIVMPSLMFAFRFHTSLLLNLGFSYFASLFQRILSFSKIRISRPFIKSRLPIAYK